MTKKCLGCNKEYSNDVWLHEDLKICSICYNIHIHSLHRRWNPKIKKWIGKEGYCKTCEVGLTFCNNDYAQCYYLNEKEKVEKGIGKWMS